MAIKIGSNIASLGAQRRFNETSAALTSTFDRLSSGLRINRAADDAAGLSISTNLNSTARLYTQSIKNINDGASAFNIVDGAISELRSILIRQTELAEQAANGTYSSAQRQVINRESRALTDEYNRIVQTTSFNRLALLDGSVTRLAVQAGVAVMVRCSLIYWAADQQLPLSLTVPFRRRVLYMIRTDSWRAGM